MKRKLMNPVLQGARTDMTYFSAMQSSREKIIQPKSSFSRLPRPSSKDSADSEEAMRQIINKPLSKKNPYNQT